MKEFISAIICVVFAAVCLIMSVTQFKEKGFLFNNAYIWASKQEREKMNKRPHYRQSAIVFAMLAAVFLCMSVECIFLTGWLWILVGGLTVAVLVYAIASSVKETK